MKRRIGTLYGKPVVEGDANIINKNEVYIKNKQDKTLELCKRKEDNKLVNIAGGSGGKSFYYKINWDLVDTTNGDRSEGEKVENVLQLIGTLATVYPIDQYINSEGMLLNSVITFRDGSASNVGSPIYIFMNKLHGNSGGATTYRENFIPTAKIVAIKTVSDSIINLISGYTSDNEYSYEGYLYFKYSGDIFKMIEEMQTQTHDQEIVKILEESLISPSLQFFVPITEDEYLALATKQSDGTIPFG